jgi:hypothetical protein
MRLSDLCRPGLWPSGFGGNGGLASSTLLNNPSSVTVASDERKFIADTDNHRIRLISAVA